MKVGLSLVMVSVVFYLGLFFWTFALGNADRPLTPTFAAWTSAALFAPMGAGIALMIQGRK